MLQEIFEELSSDDQELARQGLHVGRVINEYQESFHRGDFLVRNVAGADDAELEGAEADVELGELGLLAEDGEQGLDLSLLCGIGREREGEWSIEEGE